ncbi:MAG: substrate-binding periplasmic protein [Aestuariibacter sp.]
MKFFVVTSLILASFVAHCDVEVEVMMDNEVKYFRAEIKKDGAFEFNPEGEQSVTLATLDWAPYIDREICGQGWVQQAVVGAFIRKGYRVVSYFVPWKRAVAMTERGMVDALYPEYTISPIAMSDIFPRQKRLSLLEMSEPFPGGSVSFWKRKDTDIDFDGNLLALRNVSIGVVAGYENTPEFDALMDQRYFAVNTAMNDWANVRKLYGGRISLIVGDPEVFKFAIRQNLPADEAKQYFDELETVTPHLAEHPLFLAFSKKRLRYRDNLAVFNQSLTEMRQNEELNRIRTKYQHMAHLPQECVVLE